MTEHGSCQAVPPPTPTGGRSVSLEPEPTEDWQHNRSRLNHDWLKNRFLNRLDGILALQSSAGADTRQWLGVLSQTLAEWDKRAREIAELIDSFEEEMSPRALLAAPPLCLLAPEVRDGLGQVLHDLWRARLPIRARVASALAALGDADARHGELHRLATGSDVSGASGAAELRGAIEAFRDACRRLGEAIGTLPHEILIV